MEGQATVRVLYGRDDRVALLALRGSIRFVAARQLRKVLDAIAGLDGCDMAVIDVREVTVIDSTGLGLLARLGRSALRSLGRRAVLVCPDDDLATSLRSAAFDELFVMVDHLPFDLSVELVELPLEQDAPATSALGRVILDAHRELSSLSDENRRAYADVIAALEADLREKATHA